MTVSNVVLITIDSLRADHVSGQGHSRETTPTIDALAEDGLTFTEAVSNGPSTRSSFPSILTGTYPLMYGGYSYLSDERPFVARTFSEQNFISVAFHSNPHVGADQNYDTGFDAFNDTAEGSDNVASIKDRAERRLDPDSYLYQILRRIYHMISMRTDFNAYAKAETINENAQKWLKTERSEGDPFFLWVHYMDVHYPFMPPDEFMRKLELDPLSSRRVTDLNGRMQEDPDSLNDKDIMHLKNLYDAEIRYTDHHIDKLLSDLENMGLRNDTAIVVCSDHGEAFGEHGRFGHYPHLYDELIRVPLIVNTPDMGSKISQTPVSLIDIAPTLFDLIDIPTPGKVQGKSLLDLVDQDEERVTISACSGDTVSKNVSEWEYFATRTANWKCFWRRDIDRVELYDLTKDPGELKDVSHEYPDTVNYFRELMEEHLNEAVETELTLPEVEKSENVKQRLRDLGYTE